MGGTVVVDLDRVLLSGDAAALFVRGALAESPARAVPLLLAAPLLLAGTALPHARPLAARALAGLALGRRSGVAGVAEAYRRALAGRPEALVVEAVACVRAHRAAGDRVVVATGCEQALAEGFLTAAGLAGVEVVGSVGTVRPPRVRRAMGPAKVELLVERGHRPPFAVVYSDSASDVPLFRVADRPVLVNASARDAGRVRRALGRDVETRAWR
ncbi:haloacid dehalogenase-like hydrolase [Blastococcus sp. SYSU D00695]